MQSLRPVRRVAELGSFDVIASQRIMFQFLGSILDSLFFIGIGLFAFFRPRQMAKKEGTPEDIEKRVLLMKRLGALAIILGVGLFVFKLVG